MKTTAKIEEYVIDNGEVWLKSAHPPLIGNGLKHICGPGDALAIAYVGDILLKVGSAKSVGGQSAKLRQQCEIFDEGELQLITFPVTPETVAELNLCLRYSGRVAHLIERLTEIGKLYPGRSTDATTPD
jgi:hypothetical protein